MATDDTDGEAQDRAAAKDGQSGPARVRAWLHKTWVRVGIGVIAVLLVGGGVLWWLHARQYETTNDAFIDAHMVRVAPQVAGRVASVAVRQNQRVRAGQLLVRIDPAPEKARLNQASAQKALAQAQLAQAGDALRSAKAQARQASDELERYRKLERAHAGATSRQKLVKLKAAAQSAMAEQASARDAVVGAKARIKTLKAQIATARLDLGYTRIVAPTAGHIAERTVAVGNYVSPGTALMAIVPHRLWVTANFKETALDSLRKGQNATVSIDACGGKTVKAHVESIERGAGQAFQVLPPENATGNFVKVVQRVPVRIALDRLPHDCPLGPGMSVEVSVKVM